MRRRDEATGIRDRLEKLRERRLAGKITENEHRIESARLLDRLEVLLKQPRRFAIT